MAKWSNFNNQEIGGFSKGEFESQRVFRARIKRKMEARMARSADFARKRAAQAEAKQPETQGAVLASEHGIAVPEIAVAKRATRAVTETSRRKMTKKQHRMLLLTNFKEFCCAGRVENKNRQRVPFLWNKPQRRLNVMLAAKLMTSKPVYAAIAKARRWGCSLDVTWWMGWQMLRKPGTAVCLVLHHKDYLDEFRNRYRSMFESLPDYVVGTIDVDNAKKLVLGNGSHVDFYTAGTAATASQVGRSTGYHWCHATEVPFWHAPDQTFMALMGSMQLGPHTGVIVESTPQGAYGMFYDMYMQAKRGESDYMAYFVPWHDVEEYTIRPTADQFIAWEKWRTTGDDKWRLDMGKTAAGKPFVLADPENRIGRFKLDCGQYLWWCETLRNKFKGVLAQMKQEFGDDDVTCFLTAAKLAFEGEQIEQLRILCDAMRSQWRDVGLIYDDMGVLRLDYEQRQFRMIEPPDQRVIEQGRYLAVMDTSFGGSAQADWTVLKLYRREQHALHLCAKVKSKLQPSPFCDLTERILMAYGQPLLAIEANKGEAHINEMRMRNYPQQLRRKRMNVIDGSPVEDAIGFWMSESSRAVCLSTMDRYIRDERLIDPDDDLFSEMHTFIVNETTGKKEAAKNCNDDHVLCTSIACHIDDAYPLNASGGDGRSRDLDRRVKAADSVRERSAFDNVGRLLDQTNIRPVLAQPFPVDHGYYHLMDRTNHGFDND